MLDIRPSGMMVDSDHIETGRHAEASSWLTMIHMPRFLRVDVTFPHPISQCNWFHLSVNVTRVTRESVPGQSNERRGRVVSEHFIIIFMRLRVLSCMKRMFTGVMSF